MISTSDLRVPDYSGGSLNNLVAEMEWRLTRSAPSPRLHAGLAELIPDASTYVLVLIDGLGVHQLDHPAAGSLADAHRGTVDAPFPTTTTVSLASVATGLPPRRHGLIGHFVLLPGSPIPVNSLRWVDTTGKSVSFHTPSLLPGPNLWERLVMAGIDPITIQPASFTNTPLSRALYRGCRFEGVVNIGEFVRATVELARIPGRLILVYYPSVDIAAHMHGTESPRYARALADVATAWDRIAVRLPAHVAMVGTADHGVVAIAESGKHRLRGRDTTGVTMFGDPRSLYVKGPQERIEALGDALPAVWYPREILEDLWGPEDDSSTMDPPAAVTKPDGVFLADEGCVLLPGHMDKRLVGYHGGLDRREVEIPLLVAPSPPQRIPAAGAPGLPR